MQAASNLQRITVSEVLLDTRQDSSNKGPSKDIYFEKSSSAFAITKVGGMKLAAAANISIVGTEPGRTEGCQRCIEMARATGQPRVCGNCPHVRVQYSIFQHTVQKYSMFSRISTRIRPSSHR